MAYYVDTSALVKLVVAEAGSAELHAWATSPDRVLVSSDFARTELQRTVRRAAPSLAVQARGVLDALVLLTLTPQVMEAAARLDPPTLRSLDAVHLAAALALGDDLDGVVTYDERLADACRANGVPVVDPLSNPTE